MRQSAAGRVLPYLNGLLVDLVVASSKFLQGPVGVLSLHHDDVGTATGRDHLDRPAKHKTLDIWRALNTLHITHQWEINKSHLRKAVYLNNSYYLNSCPVLSALTPYFPLGIKGASVHKV